MKLSNSICNPLHVCDCFSRLKKTSQCFHANPNPTWWCNATANRMESRFCNTARFQSMSCVLSTYRLFSTANSSVFCSLSARSVRCFPSVLLISVHSVGRLRSRFCNTAARRAVLPSAARLRSRFCNTAARCAGATQA